MTLQLVLTPEAKADAAQAFDGTRSSHPGSAWRFFVAPKR